MRWIIVFLLGPGPLLAQAIPASDPLDALVQDSPFLPPAGAGPAAATATGPLEFRGVVFEGGRFLFSVYDQGSRISHWIGFDEGDAPVIARSYDREQDILTVEHQGRTVALKLQVGHVEGQSPGEASPAPLPGAAEAAQPSAAAPSAPDTSRTTPAAESQRLQELADELRRRREAPGQAPGK